MLATDQVGRYNLILTVARTVVGAGCYPRAAVLNHSCAPNCVLTSTRGSLLSIRTTADLPAGAGAWRETHHAPVG